MGFLFKSGDEVFDEGIDLVKRREYGKARNSFQKSIDKKSAKADISRVYILIIDTITSPSASNFNTLADGLEKANMGSIQFGLSDIDTQKFAVECKLLAEKADLMSTGGDAAAKEERGRKMIQLAQRIQVAFGKDSMKYAEIAKGDTTSTGIKEALALQALGYETIAEVTVLTDPKKAAEYMQNASNYKRQAGENADADIAKVQQYSRSAKCWICGRLVTGEGIHFVGMSSDMTPLQRIPSPDEIVKSASDTFESIFVCRACYSAVSRRADAIALKYHQTAMAELQATEARLMAEIASLRSSINAISINR